MKFIHTDIDGFLEESRALVCFGAGPMFEEAVQTLGLADRIIKVVDNSSEKQGRTVGIGDHVFSVDDPAVIAEISEPFEILITSRFYEAIVAELEDVAALKDTVCYAYPCLKLYLDPKKDSYRYWRLVEPILRTYEEVLDYRRTPAEEKRRLLTEKERYLTEEIDDVHRAVVPRVVFSHFNRCNLNCEYCGALLPDTEQHYHIPSADVLHDIDLFLRGIEECLMVDLTDGEPFLNSELDIILRALNENQKVFSIFFYTNGTVLPNQKTLEQLKNEKVTVMISDYGYLDKMCAMIALFEREGVNFGVMSDMEWMNTDSLESRGRSLEFLRYHFANCEAGKTRKRMKQGRLYTCTRAQRFCDTGVVCSGNDYEGLLDTDSDDILRAKIMRLYLSDRADACDFCDYGNMAVEMVPAGIQRGGKHKKSDYTVVSREEYEGLREKVRLS